ncbi:PHP domain-containing protein [bacterium]|nr:PHP domain-containing protein [bacterium]
MADTIDLHMHTTCSDGKKTPSELLAMVRRSGVAAFAVTDHDTLDGFREIRDLLEPGDPELVPGIELSAKIGDRDVHLLAYLFDPDHPGLNLQLEEFRKKRERRGRMIVERLEELGLSVPFEEVEKAAGEGVIGRPHIAEAMVASGAIHTYEEAFRKYISNSGPAYVPKSKMTPGEAINLTHEAGGVAVLAHPFIDDMYEQLPMLVRHGLDGIEIYHYSHKSSDVDRARELARRYDLLPSGGSDFHGRESRNSIIGSSPVPMAFLDDLKTRALQIRGAQ